MLCQVLAFSSLKNVSAQSDLVLFCASENKILELELVGYACTKPCVYV